MLKPINSIPAVVASLIVLSLGSTCLAQSSLTAKATSFQPQPVTDSAESDRTRDGLVGPVRRVRTEIVKLTNSDGRILEGKRALLEVVAYDIKGAKIENQYYPVAGSTLTGKEVYKYDDKGNISEMTLVNTDGSLLSKENYKYEFDFAGNWNKMTTSVAVVDGGKFTFEPTEVTYRSIMYYLDANMVKMVQPDAQPKGTSPAPAPAPNSSPENVAKNSEPKNSPTTGSASKQPAPTQKSAPALPPPSVVAGNLSVNNSNEGRSISGNSTGNTQVTMEEPPPMPAPRPILKPISGGVLNGTALTLPMPTYPETAKRMRASGTVTVEVVIDEMGKVISAQASSGPSILREAAVSAALRARFSPTKLSGQPVKVAGVINYKFALSSQ